MSIKNKLIILILLFFMLLFVFFINNKKEDADKLGNTNIDILNFSLDEKDKVSRVRVAGSLGSYDLNRVDTFKSRNPILTRSNWVLREPLYAPVNEQNVKDLIDLLFSLKGEIVPLGELERSKLGEYGLEPPLLILILNIEDKNIVLSFGHPNKVTQQLFLQKDGDSNLYLLPEDTVTSIQKLLATIRSYDVLKFDTKKVNQIDVVKSENFYRLSKQKCNLENIWKVTADGLEMKADSRLVDEKLSELSNLKVNKIYDSPMDILQFTGLASPMLIIKVRFNMEQAETECSVDESPQLKNSEVLLQIGKGVDISNSNNKLAKTISYYMKIAGENIIYELENAAFGDWLQSSEHFRNRVPLQDKEIEVSQKIEVILPEKKCARISQLKDDADFKMLQVNIKNLKLDTIISLSEFTDFEKVNGVRFSFHEDPKCSNGFEQIGVISQNQSDGENKSVAAVLKFSMCNEKDLYGVTEYKEFANFSKFLERYCK
jgi:hypothetical protein